MSGNRERKGGEDPRIKVVPVEVNVDPITFGELKRAQQIDYKLGLYRKTYSDFMQEDPDRRALIRFIYEWPGDVYQYFYNGQQLHTTLEKLSGTDKNTRAQIDRFLKYYEYKNFF